MAQGLRGKINKEKKSNYKAHKGHKKSKGRVSDPPFRFSFLTFLVTKRFSCGRGLVRLSIKSM